MPKLVLEITDRHSAIETPDCKAVPEQMWMDAMPVFSRLVLAFDLLQKNPLYRITSIS